MFLRRWNFVCNMIALTAVTVALVCFLFTPVSAQPSGTKPRGKPLSSLELKRLDTKMEEVRESFLRETTTLIKSYEDAGQLERAKTLLEALFKLDPLNEPVKNKLSSLQERIFDSHEFDIDLDTAKAWQPLGTVTKDRPLRIVVSGEYKFSTSLSTGPNGFPTENPAEDLIPGVPLGSVIAVIAAPGAPATKDKGPKPFSVGKDYQKPAERDGVLYLKVNAPPGSKCTGKLQVKISGAIPPE